MSNKKKFTYLREIELKYKIKKIESNVIGNVATDPEIVVNLFSDLQNETKEKLKRISKDLGLFFFDHIIVGIDSYYSFAQDELNQ